MDMLTSVMPRILQTLTGYNVIVNTTPVVDHVIIAARASTKNHGNQPLLTVPMNVNPATAMAMPMIVTMTQRLTITRLAKIVMANLKEEVYVLTVSITQLVSTVKDAVQDTINLQIIQQIRRMFAIDAIVTRISWMAPVKTSLAAVIANQITQESTVTPARIVTWISHTAILYLSTLTMILESKSSQLVR